MEPDVLHSLTDLVRMLLALGFVLALMGGLAYGLKRLGLAGPVNIPGKKTRLRIVESLPLDARRRLVLIQRDTIQHLVILGASGETVIETGIDSPAGSNHETAQIDEPASKAS